MHSAFRRHCTPHNSPGAAVAMAPLRAALSCLSLLVLASRHALAAPQCDFSATSGICSDVAGERLPAGSHPHVNTLFLLKSDLSQLSADAFASFHSVTALYLNKCNGPPADRHPLVKLPQLQELHITCAGPQGEEELGTLAGDAKELRSVTMHRCGLRFLDTALVGQLPRLRTLDLRRNALQRVDAAALGALRELRLLRLEHNLLLEVPALEGPRVAMWLHGNPLCDARPPTGDVKCVPSTQRPMSLLEAEQLEEEVEDVEEVEEEMPEDELLVRPRGVVLAEPPKEEPSRWTMDAVSLCVGALFSLLFCVLGVLLLLLFQKSNNRRAHAHKYLVDPEGSSDVPQPPAYAVRALLLDAAQKSAAAQQP